MTQVKNRDEALEQRVRSSGLSSERQEEILGVVRGATALKHGMPVEVERASKGKRAPNGAEYHVKVKASTESIARDNGIIPMRAWQGGGLRNFSDNPVILAFHSHRDPIGISVYTEIDGDSLTQYWLFHEETETSRTMKTLYEKGFMRAASVGFLVHEWKLVDELSERELEELVEKYGAKAIRDLWWIAERAELLETSAVPVPSDPNALAFSQATTNARAHGIDISELARKFDNRSDEMSTDKQNAPADAADTASQEETETVESVRAEKDAEIAGLREQIAGLEQQVAALQDAAASAAAAPTEPNGRAEESRAEGGDVTVEIEVREGETKEQAVARYIDSMILEMRGAPVPSAK